MTLQDYIKETKYKFEQKPFNAAAGETIAEFKRGIRRRYNTIRLNVFGPQNVASKIAGIEATFYVDDRVEAQRAKNLNREEPIAEWLFTDCDDQTVFWDIGAYHGHYSVLAAMTGAQVIAFEPSKPNREYIWKNALLNTGSKLHDTIVIQLDTGKIELKNFALSDSNEAKNFGGPSQNELRIGSGTDFVSTKRGDLVDAPVPDIIKIDVEGHEIEVLNGMGGTLRLLNKIAIEIHDDVSESEIVKRLEHAGLETKRISTTRSEVYIGGVRK